MFFFGGGDEQGGPLLHGCPFPISSARILPYPVYETFFFPSQMRKAAQRKLAFHFEETHGDRGHGLDTHPS